jgi:hypothetical protein
MVEPRTRSELFKAVAKELRTSQASALPPAPTTLAGLVEIVRHLALRLDLTQGECQRLSAALDHAKRSLNFARLANTQLEAKLRPPPAPIFCEETWPL